ncbi:hypothetical protein B9G55_17735 [Saccharibacillus sp. O16]|nr:hypothetical protein B9G55_17735 [Saccharibacillus sp. O16]
MEAIAMKPGIPVPRRVGPSLVALLLSAGVLLPVLPYASPLYAAENTQSQNTQSPSVPMNLAAVRITVTDAVNKKALDDVKITLYWADTAANRAAGRPIGKPVSAVMSNPQNGENSSSLDRLLPIEGDYEVAAEKSGYLPFDSRRASGSSASTGAVSALHVGTSGTTYTLALTPAAHTYPAYMSGYTDGMFRPEQNVKRVELAAILQRSVGKMDSAVSAQFRDIEPGKWSAASVAFVASKGWMQGTGGEKFEPNREVTRAELAQILTNVFDWDTSSRSSTFPDTAGHWAAGAISAAAAHGALSGDPSGKFRPDEAVTRAEAAIIMNRLIGRPADPGLPMTWSDVPPSHWAFGDIMAASLDHTPSAAR